MRYLIALMAGCLCTALSAHGATINVPGDYTTIQEAINASSDGDVIQIGAGVFYESALDPATRAITFQGTLNGNGTLATTIDAQQQWSVFNIDNGEGPDTVIANLVITGGSRQFGGGIRCSGSSPTITGCEFIGNAAVTGGAVYYRESNAVITECTFRDNDASNYGAALAADDSIIVMEDCNVLNNTASLSGGGVYTYSSGELTVRSCQFSGNIATGNGGGVNHSAGGNFLIDNCVLTNNQSLSGSGGGISNNGYMTMTNCVVIENQASNGGGAAVSGFPTLIGNTVCGNVPNQIYGSYSDEGGNTIEATCPLPGACCTNDICVVSEQDDCATYGGSWLGEGTTCDDSPCPSTCLGDTDGDGEVNVNDILLVIARWGVTCP